VKNAEKKEWLFILTLTFTLALSLVIPDLIKGGQRSISTRYLISFILGIQLSLAYLFAHKIYQQKLWQIIIAGVLTIGVISCCINYQATTAWSKVVSYNNGQVADIINQKEKPLLITRRFAINFGNIFALSHLLQNQVKFQLIDAKLQPYPSYIPPITEDFSDIFLLNPAEEFQQEFEKVYDTQLDLVYKDKHLQLWQVN
jgi:uncharacterized membrane protein